MRIGVYGGSFDPPHVGHGMVAAWLRWTGRVDEVWLVPVWDHPFGKDVSPYEDRWRWCEALATTVGEGVRVHDVERQLGRTSYTVETLDALAARHPEHAFHLIVGTDAWTTRDAWRAWDRIASTYEPVWVGRAGHRVVPDAPSFPDVSSTEVRRRLAAGEPVDHLVPAAVLAAMGHG